MSDKEIKEGDQVSWQWSGSRPGGTVSEIAKEGELSIETKRGNEVKKNADPEDPAVKISRSGNDVVKRAHELDVEKEGDKHKEDQGQEKTVTKDETKEENGDDKKEEDAEKKEAEKEEKEAEKEMKESNKADEKKEEGEAKTGDKREASDEAADEEPSKKQQKTDEDGEENGDKKKRGRPAKNGNETSTSKPKKEPKKAATESGEPRRSSRLNSS
ncbi:hypothetical protein D6D01_01360 [Aureobasidium pullulans]|uniref:Hypervirulence associated protein TUDOR domain-containing protein n=1 Tax=Aureobasidium pullulans TaxID=5580 RepID=A0A4V4JY25_AURPU|nr:hypothetical protein D6D01_01360 [Aureobasidium pullulans]